MSVQATRRVTCSACGEVREARAAFLPRGWGFIGGGKLAAGERELFLCGACFAAGVERLLADLKAPPLPLPEKPRVSRPRRSLRTLP